MSGSPNCRPDVFKSRETARMRVAKREDTHLSKALYNSS